MSNFLSDLIKPSKKTTIICVVLVLIGLIDPFLTGGTVLGGILIGIGGGILIYTKILWKYFKKKEQEK